MTKSKRKLGLKIFLQLAISALLLVIVYRSSNFDKLLETLKSFSWMTALEISLVYALGQILSAFKWSIFVRQAEIGTKMLQIIRAYFLGMFVNNFGFGTVGGDVARSVALFPPQGKRAPAFATVIADRVHGLAVLVTIGAISAAIFKPAVLGPHPVVIGLTALATLILGWLIGPSILLKLFPGPHKLSRLAKSVRQAFPMQLNVVIPATAISALFHLSQIYMVYLIAQKLGAPLSFTYLLATVPVVNVITSLPISINGLGVRESLFLTLFSPMGTTNEQCIAIGALWLVAVTVVAAIGGVVIGAQSIQAVTDEAEEKSPKEEFMRDVEPAK
ncbi:flippase-like domain-containing protein [bacterium]|nr:flippase-like domain-containing protein [bacterium]